MRTPISRSMPVFLRDASAHGCPRSVTSPSEPAGDTAPLRTVKTVPPPQGPARPQELPRAAPHSPRERPTAQGVTVPQHAHRVLKKSQASASRRTGRAPSEPPHISKTKDQGPAALRSPHSGDGGKVKSWNFEKATSAITETTGGCKWGLHNREQYWVNGPVSGYGGEPHFSGDARGSVRCRRVTMPCSKNHTHTLYVHSRYGEHGKLLFWFQRHPFFKAMLCVTST